MRWAGMQWTLRRQAACCPAKSLQRTAKSCGPGAATVAPIHAGPCWHGNGDKKRRSPGRARISRKAIARGKPGCLGCTCQTRVRSCYPLHTVLRAQSAPGFSLRLSFGEERRTCGNSGENAPRECPRLSSPGSTGRPSIPEAAVIDPIGRGVLDHPLSLLMTSRGRAKTIRPHLHLALRQKTCTLPTCRAASGVAKPMSSQVASSQVAPKTMPSDTESRALRAEDAQAEDRLRNDIRLLGRILGDTVRDQEGADVFDLVERIRQTSIRFHRDNDMPARRELELILDSMSISQTLRIVRAFSYFSHLANIAEDQNNIRQMRTGPGGGPRASQLSQSLAHARDAGFTAADLRRFFETAQVSPVLTAHPTEVRRKSTMDREMEIASLLDRRERVQLTPEETAAEDEQLRRDVVTLWQTNLLRRTQLTVLDEVANGLSFYDYTFLREVPRLHCALEDRLNAEDAPGDPGDGRELASFLRIGSWTGGDRDGNPFVTAEVMRGTLRLQSSRVLRFYLEELHALGAELSIAAHLADVSGELRALAERSRDPSPHRSGEPYRLAVSGIYARLAAAALKLEVETSRRPVAEAEPYATAQ